MRVRLPAALLPAAFLALLTDATPGRGQNPTEFGPTFHALGFGDVVYEATQRPIPNGFYLGQAVGHLSASLTDRLAAFTEVTATAQPAGFALGVERMFLRYDFSDRFKLSVGRYHTPIGYWNTAYHHGLWLQTSVARPEMIRFGSRVLPVHFVGVRAEGNLLSRALGMSYVVGMGNGRSSNLALPGDAGDVNAQRAWLARLTSRPASLLGLEVGGGVVFDRAATAAGMPVDERILSTHLALTREAPELIAEYARLLHEPRGTGRTAASDAYYVQLAYRLPEPAHALKPYVRGERVRVPGDDALLSPLNLGYRAVLAGVRYDFSPFAALKAEGRREEFQGARWTNSLFLQASLVLTGLLGGSDAAAPPSRIGLPVPPATDGR